MNTTPKMPQLLSFFPSFLPSFLPCCRCPHLARMYRVSPSALDAHETGNSIRSSLFLLTSFAEWDLFSPLISSLVFP